MNFQRKKNCFNHHFIQHTVSKLVRGENLSLLMPKFSCSHPCLEWSSELVEREQGSSPKGPISCSTQGWISRRPEMDLKSVWQNLVQKSRFEVWGAGLTPRGQIWGLMIWFEAWRADLRSGGLIWGLEGRYEVWRADLSSWGLNWCLRGLIWGLRGPNQAWDCRLEAPMAKGGGRTGRRTSWNRPFGAPKENEGNDQW